MKSLKLSVHQLVDFLLRTGDIDTRVFNRSSMNEGSKLHTIYQSHQEKNYMAEYPLKTSITVDEITVEIEGRADGIIKNDIDDYTIDEIKTTVQELGIFNEQNKDWHLGQAKLYGYMFLKEQGLSKIKIKLVYIKQGNTKEKLIQMFEFTYLELEQFVLTLLEDYLDFYRIISRRLEERDSTLKNLDFPFEEYRNGQKSLMKYCYAIAKKGGNLFVEAPTGIGKTISTLFPYVKSLINNHDSKIFYLTAKSSGKEAAYNAIKRLNRDTNVSTIVITAKEKICFCKEKKCNPDNCIYAKGYYDKIQTILRFVLSNYSLFDYQAIVELAYDYQVCPFELSLDISLFTDVIICDYNYVFDPIGYLKRFFDDDYSKDLLLIDEAHNLVDRSRAMYSETIKEEDFLLAKKSSRHISEKSLKNSFSKISKIFNQIKENTSEGNNVVEVIDDAYLKAFDRFTDVISDLNTNKHESVTNETTEFYLFVNRFLKIYEIKTNRFVIYYEKNKGLINIHLLCLDASNYLRVITNHIKGSVFFSATLSPMDYYIDTLGGDKNLDPVLILDSPFPKDNFLLMVAPKVSIKYKNRNSTYSIVSEYIKAFVINKVGNYLVFLPSYEYLNNLLPVLDLPTDITVFTQNKDMTEQERLEFINKFSSSPKNTTIGFAIIGGAFSEGIDLVSDRLIGAVIVGTGLPKINFESDETAKYYDSIKLDGNAYAYVYPGMNKVMQAVGRVIRDKDDRGAVLLIDERYTTSQYQSLYKKEWSNYQIVLSSNEVKELTRDFYSK